MARLRLRLDKYFEGDTGNTRVVAQVRPLGGKPRAAGDVRSVTLPVGKDGARWETVDGLQPGRYMVEAFLPSGEIVAAEASTDQDEQVVLTGEPSPHEWLGFQHLWGNIPGREQFELERVEQGPAPAIPAVALVGPPLPAVGREPLAESCDRAWRAGKAVELEGYVEPALQLDTVVDGPVVSYRVHPGQATGAPGLRRYLLAGAPPALLCVLPWPWPNADGGGEALVEVLVGPELQASSTGGGARHFAAPLVRDSQISSALAYLGSGDLPSARRSLRVAQELLFEKMVNPVAAAGGACVLVSDWLRQEGEAAQRERWFGWVDTLARSVPWLPDGPILAGWLALRGGAEPRVDQARAALLEAHRRGLPFYAASLRLLYDGLTLLANDAAEDARGDDELQAALAAVRRLVLRLDVRQPFTVLQLGR